MISSTRGLSSATLRAVNVRDTSLRSLMWSAPSASRTLSSTYCAYSLGMPRASISFSRMFSMSSPGTLAGLFTNRGSPSTILTSSYLVTSQISVPRPKKEPRASGACSRIREYPPKGSLISSRSIMLTVAAMVEAPALRGAPVVLAVPVVLAGL